MAIGHEMSWISVVKVVLGFRFATVWFRFQRFQLQRVFFSLGCDLSFDCAWLNLQCRLRQLHHRMACQRLGVLLGVFKSWQQVQQKRWSSSSNSASIVATNPLTTVLFLQVASQYGGPIHAVEWRYQVQAARLGVPHLHRSFLAFVWMLLTLSTVILVFCDVKVSMKKCDVFDFISVQIRYVICVCYELCDATSTSSKHNSITQNDW
jgi:hypothetical protein